MLGTTVNVLSNVYHFYVYWVHNTQWFKEQHTINEQASNCPQSSDFFFQSVYSDLVEIWVTFRRLLWRNRGLTFMILTWSTPQFSFLWTTTHPHCAVILVDSRHKNILLIYVTTHSSFRSVIVQPLMVCVVFVVSFTVRFYFIILWTHKIQGIIWTLSYLFKFDLWSIIWLPLEKVLWATKKECICTIFWIKYPVYSI